MSKAVIRALSTGKSSQSQGLSSVFPQASWIVIQAIEAPVAGRGLASSPGAAGPRSPDRQQSMASDHRRHRASRCCAAGPASGI